MPKVTYLFGAGASCNCLPTIEDIPAEFEKFRAALVHFNADAAELLFGMAEFNYSQARQLFVEACEKISTKLLEHASVDTYAKKLFLTKQFVDYLSLKSALSCFFIYLQILNQIDESKENLGDYRYDGFFASILKNDSMGFNGDLNILSWNYDFQFERAYSKYSLHDDLKTNQELLHVYPDGFRPDNYSQRFSIFKINGTTSFANLNKRGQIEHPIPKFGITSKDQILKQCIWYYIAATQREAYYKPNLSFAWEYFPTADANSLINVATRAITQSAAIVIIGYSFPFFNREVDQAIIAAASSTPYRIKLPRFYVQDLNPRGVINRLSSMLSPNYPDNNIVEITAVDSRIDKKTRDQFYLPAEL